MESCQGQQGPCFRPGLHSTLGILQRPIPLRDGTVLDHAPLQTGRVHDNDEDNPSVPEIPMKLVAVCIAKDDVSNQWQSNIPFVCYTDGFQYFPHFPRLKTRFRIEYLAKRRNNACQKAV